MGNTPSNMTDRFNPDLLQSLEDSSQTLHQPLPISPPAPEKMATDSSPMQSVQAGREDEDIIKECEDKIQEMFKTKADAERRLKERRQQEKMAAKQVFLDECRKRQDGVRNDITDHIIREISEIASSDPSAVQAIHRAALKNANDQQYAIVRQLLTKALVGADLSFLHSVAVRVYNYTTEPNARIAEKANDGELAPDSNTLIDSEPPQTKTLKSQNPSTVKHTPNASVNQATTVKLPQFNANVDKPTPREHQATQKAQTISGKPVSAPKKVTSTANVTKEVIHGAIPTKAKQGSESGRNLKDIARQSLLQIENRDTPESQASIDDHISKVVSAAGASPREKALTPSSAASSRSITLSSESKASKSSPRGRGTVSAVKVGEKRSRSEVSDTSQPTGPTPTPTPKKSRNTPTQKKGKVSMQQNFVNKIESLSGKGTNVDQEFRCQRCKKEPKDVKVSPCAHVYCISCLRAIRIPANKKASKGEGPGPTCVTCNSKLSTCMSISGDVFKNLKRKHTKLGGDDESSGVKGGKDDGDESEVDGEDGEDDDDDDDEEDGDGEDEGEDEDEDVNDAKDDAADAADAAVKQT